MKSVLQLIACLSLPLIVGGLSGIATAEGVSGWYQTVQKPSFNPPSWVFGPVWTLLYLLMGAALFFIWNAPKSEWRNLALLFFFAQLTLNFFWSFLFFKFHWLGWALVEIVLLWLCILAMIYALYRLKPLWAFSQIPYLLWVSFATALNAAFWWINRS